MKITQVQTMEDMLKMVYEMSQKASADIGKVRCATETAYLDHDIAAENDNRHLATLNEVCHGGTAKIGLTLFTKLKDDAGLMTGLKQETHLKPFCEGCATLILETQAADIAMRGLENVKAFYTISNLKGGEKVHKKLMRRFETIFSGKTSEH